MPETHSTESIYTLHHQQSRGENFMLFPKERGEFLRSRIGTGKKILDIGCRDGALTRLFMEGNEVLGVDVDSEALERAAKLGISTQHVDLNGEWPLPLEEYDAVVAAEILEHLYFPKAVLEKIHACLKPGGVLVGSVPNAFSLKNRVRLFLGRKVHTPLADPTHINHFTRSELEKLLRSQFAEVEIQALGNYAYLDRVWPGMFAFDFLFWARK